MGNYPVLVETTGLRRVWPESAQVVSDIMKFDDFWWSAQGVLLINNKRDRIKRGRLNLVYN